MTYSIEFGDGEKILSYSSEELNKGDIVIFKTSEGEEIGKIISCFKNQETQNNEKIPQQKRTTTSLSSQKQKVSANIVRKATLQEYENAKTSNAELLKTCREKANTFNIPVKIASARVQFDKNKLHIDLLPENKGGVKTFLKEITKIYKEKIVIHQVGRRDLTRRFATCGICSRPLCCATFLDEFEPINMELIKLQNLSCGTAKLTGMCGKLMCCLAYEKENYKK